MNKVSFAPKMKEIKREWHFIDATDEILGKLSTKIAKLLMGKNKAIFTPNENVGDKVVVTNAAKVKFTGKKLKDKVYFHHTGYPKGLRSENLETLLKRKPTEVLTRSVKGMLPKNRLRDLMMKNFYVYPGAENPHSAQQKNK
jgi:large subunit ribosomal protein L13